MFTGESRPDFSCRFARPSEIEEAGMSKAAANPTFDALEAARWSKGSAILASKVLNRQRR
jgi:hypothetical protein